MAATDVSAAASAAREAGVPLSRVRSGLVQGGLLRRLPVVEANSGRRLARVLDVAFDPHGGSVIALQLEFVDPKHRGDVRWVSASHFAALGPGAILWHGKAPAGYALPESREIPVIGLRVVTEDGRLLGEIADVLFDTSEHRLWGYELSNGVLWDLWDGRKALPYIASGSSGGWRFGDVCLVGEDATLRPLVSVPALDAPVSNGARPPAAPPLRSRMSLAVGGKATSVLGGLR